MSADGKWIAELEGLGGDAKAERLRLEAVCGNIDRLSELIKAGVDVNKSDAGGTTALMKASVCGRDECIPVLLEAGAELEHVDNNGFTALMDACFSGHEACARTLLNAGANLLAVNKGSRTAEQLAAEQAQTPFFSAEYRERCRRCVHLLQQPRRVHAPAPRGGR